jgi:hypothetical protein
MYKRRLISNMIHNISLLLKSLHWLKVKECIEYKVISLTYNTLQLSQPSFLRTLITLHYSHLTALSQSAFLDGGR